MPALGSYQPITYQFRDHTGEVKSVKMNVNSVTVLTLPGILLGLGELETALDAITLGTRSKNTLAMETVVSNATPANNYAQVESQLLVSLWGVTTEQPFSYRIPTIDADKLNFVSGAEDLVDISATGATAETLALIEAIEAITVTPWDEAEGVKVLSMRFVGANI